MGPWIDIPDMESQFTFVAYEELLHMSLNPKRSGNVTAASVNLENSEICNGYRMMKIDV